MFNHSWFNRVLKLLAGTHQMQLANFSDYLVNPFINKLP